MPPEITIIEAPGEGENYTDNFSIKVNVFDKENDSYVSYPFEQFELFGRLE